MRLDVRHAARPALARRKPLHTLLAASSALLALAVSAPALAQVKIGFIFGATGANASLGVNYQRAISLLPRTVGGEPAEYLFYDDQSDATTAVKGARKLTLEDKVDILVGSSSTPSSQGIAEVALETRTPQLAMAPINIAKDKWPWIFSLPQPVPLMMEAVVERMKADGVKRVSYIGFADAWGDVVLKSFQGDVDKLKADIQVVASERYARNDTSVTSQVLKMLAPRPDAVLIGASGTPGALPQIGLVERGFRGHVYHTHGAINREFLRIGGKSVEGAMAPAGPVTVAEQLPDSNPIKKIASDFNRAWDAAYGRDTRNAFSGYTYDAWVLTNAAATAALRKGRPGTPEFRQALRDGIESAKNVVGVHGIYNLSPDDHSGTDSRARVMVRVENGDWRYLP
jgi:branched-chain amino acid transport system substrate-binding protein